MMDFRPILGLVFSNLRPWKASILFSSTTGSIVGSNTHGAEVEQRNEPGEWNVVVLGKALINFLESYTASEIEMLDGNGSSGRFGLSMATAGCITSS